LTYSSLNDGSVGNNTATIINKFNFPITGARVRFVVPKGTPYYLRNATIKQEFDGTNYHIVDATLNLEQSSTTVVSIHAGIQEDLCPLDPNKMDPGICGCGVPEGSCPIPVAEISLKPANSRINVNTTRQLVATISPLSATNKAVLWESSTPSVAAINAFGKVTALAEGTTTITATTVDGAKTSSAAITVLPNNPIYQAEDAEFVGAAVSTEQSGFRGAGYIDYVNSSNDFIKWTVFVEEAGTYALSFRYGLASGNRPLKLTVNEEVRIASTVFPATGTWTNWSTFLTNQVLEQGINTITLTATGASGGNIDELSLKNTALGLNDLKLNQGGRKVKIAPNPISKGVLTVSTDGFEDDTNIRVKISNTNGQTIYQNAITDTCHTDINLSGKLSNAVYFVTVESDQRKITNKLIVKQ
ncbi:MAG: Ig-like domain-containing protein, partial [Flavobacterium sp.]